MNFGITETAERIHRGELSPRTVVTESLQRLESIAHLNALRFLLSEKALTAADRVAERIAAGEKLPLAGACIAVKDNIVTQGDENTAASRILAGYVSPFTATAVERLEQAGAIVVAKTNLDEFAMGSSGENSAYGNTLHPKDPNYVPGGSSSGSAVVTASGAVHAALGSETGGSVRQPAAFCGITGVKPSYGRISRYGLIAFASSLDQIGVFAPNVRDAETVLYVMAGSDERDATSSREPVPEPETGFSDLQGMRIAALKIDRDLSPQPAISNAMELARNALQLQGAEVQELEFPLFKHSVEVYYVLATAEASANLARYDGGRYGKRVEREGLRETYNATRGEGFGREVKRRILLGTFVLSSGFIDAYYRKAMLVRRKMANEFHALMKEYDALLLPTTPTTAFRIGEKVSDPVAMYLSDIFTIPANLIGCPAVSVPYGVNADGWPVGLQIMGKPFAEARMFRIASALERVTGK